MKDSSKRARRGFTLIELMVVISILSILLLILLPNYVKAKSRSRLNACMSNLRTMATACEQYASDNKSAYPTTLAIMVSQYLRSIQKCPSAVDTTSYTTGFTSSSNPDNYTIMCKGNLHADLGIPTDYPRYNLDSGMKEQ